jgi:hypothetical protein
MQLPVVLHGRLVGVVGYEQIAPMLAEGPYSASLRRQTVADVMVQPQVVADANETVTSLCRRFARSLVTTVSVVGPEGEYLGTVFIGDLVAPGGPPPYPARVGGMATPFGVYLTNGRVRGGVNDIALFSAGVVLGLLSTAACAIATALFWLATQMHILSVPGGITLSDLADVPDTVSGLPGILWTVAVLITFMLLMRATRMAAFHAAEHQAVHAMERQEQLTPETLARMPRPHPRCGTNIWVASLLYCSLLQALLFTRYFDVTTAGIFAAVITLFLWRRVGAVVQQLFTTRPAGEAELRSGIHAAEQLMQRYLETPPGKTKPLQRIWCMGMIQSACGMMSVLGILQLALYAWSRTAH